MWQGMQKDCADFVRKCIPCQRNKVNRHNKSPISTYVMPSERFEHLNIDIIGPMPMSEGNKYCLTIIDRFTRYPQAVPMADMTAATVAKSLISGWISSFGTPRRISSDLGGQFQASIFVELSRLLGIDHLSTTAYHPQANGIIERWHRTLKAAIKCHQSTDWCNTLPFVLLGLRTTLKEDISATPSEMVYGSTIRIPGEFFNESKPKASETLFAQDLRRRMREIKPVPASNHNTKEKVFIQKELSKCSHVFVRHDAVRTPLQPPYDGPYEVLKRYDKYFLVKIKDRTSKVSIDRLKAAHITVDDIDYHVTEPRLSPIVPLPSTATDASSTQPVQRTQHDDQTSQPAHPPKQANQQANQPAPVEQHKTTRSGRRVVIPRRYH